MKRAIVTVCALVTIVIGGALVAQPAAAETVAVTGVTVTPSGVPVPNAGINVRNADYTFNAGGGAGPNGVFQVFVPGSGMPNGTYFLDIFPAFGTTGLISPAATQFTYSGSPVNLGNIAFVAATKTLTVNVVYDNGGAVTTANVWANRPEGGFGAGTDVNGSGRAVISLSGGTYNIGVSPMWNQELQRQMDVDWTFSQPPTTVTFAQDTSTESQTFTFTVQRTNARIAGRLIKPDGSPASQLGIGCHSGFGGGPGTQTDSNGAFSMAVQTGEWQCEIWVDPMNPTYARYSSPQMQASVAVGTTFDFGTLTLGLKEATITGRVTNTAGAPIANFRINAWPEGQPGWNQAMTDGAGNYTMYVLGPGSYNVEPDRSQTDYIYSGPPGRAQLTSTTATASGINFTVTTPNASIIVTTVDASGNALGNVFGYAECRKAGDQPGPGNQFGNGINQGYATIPLYVNAATTFSCGTWLGPESNLLLLDRVNVTVAPGSQERVRLVLIAPDATITGTLVDQNGVAVTGIADGIEINAMQFTGSGEEMFGGGNMVNTRLRSDGTFSIQVRGGQKYNLGFWIRPEASAGGNFLNSPPKSQPFEVPANGTINRTLTIFRANTSVSGQLLDPAGNPTPGFVFCGNWRFMENKIKGDFAGGKEINTGTEVREDGNFRLPLVAGTKYDCGANVPHFLKDGASLNVNMPPEMVEVNPTVSSPVGGLVLRFTKADHLLNATVRLEDGSTPAFGWCHAFQESEKGGKNSGGEVQGGQATIPLTSGTWFVGCDSHNPATGDFWRSPEQQVTVVAGESSKAFVLEKSLFRVPQAVSDTFDCTQSRTITLENNVSLAIPASALATSGTCTVTITPDVNLFATADSKPFTFGYDMSASTGGQSITGNFNSAVTLSIPAPSDEELKQLGLTEDEILPKVYDETSSTWKDPDGSNYDSDSNTWSISLNHFTDLSLNTGATSTNAKRAHLIISTPLGSGGPQVVVKNNTGKTIASFFAYDSRLRVEVEAIEADIDGDGTNEIVTVTGSGAGPQVGIFSNSGKLLRRFFAFGKELRCGYHVAAANTDGKGGEEIIVTTRAGCGPQVAQFSGNGSLMSQYFVYAKDFRGGVAVKAADLDGDGLDELAFIPESGAASRVVVRDGTAQRSFLAYADTVIGGFNLATGDVDGDNDVDLIVTPKAGNGPQVAVLDGTGKVLKRYFAYATDYRGGVNVAAGDTDGDGTDDVVTLPATDAVAQVRIFNDNGKLRKSFDAYPNTMRGSFTLAVTDLDGNGTAEVVTAPGSGFGPQVRSFNAAGKALNQYMSLHSGFRGGVKISTFAE